MLPGSCPGVGLHHAGGVKNFSVGICDGAPSTARSSFLCDRVCTQSKKLYEGYPGQGSKIALVCLYLRVSKAAGQVKIFIFLVKIIFFPCMPIFFVMQGKCYFKIFRGLLVAFDREKCGLENGV